MRPAPHGRYAPACYRVYNRRFSHFPSLRGTADDSPPQRPDQQRQDHDRARPAPPPAARRPCGSRCVARVRPCPAARRTATWTTYPWSNPLWHLWSSACRRSLAAYPGSRLLARRLHALATPAEIAGTQDYQRVLIRAGRGGSYCHRPMATRVAYARATVLDLMRCYHHTIIDRAGAEAR